MKSKRLALMAAALLAAASALADDGEQTLKRMTGGSIDNQLNVLPEDVGLGVSEAEHAFTDYMKFYVPSQAASGLIGPVTYNNVDLNYVEELAVAKPLVNVFIYGPAIEPPLGGACFADDAGGDPPCLGAGRSRSFCRAVSGASSCRWPSCFW